MSDPGEHAAGQQQWQRGDCRGGRHHDDPCRDYQKTAHPGLARADGMAYELGQHGREHQDERHRSGEASVVYWK